MLIPAQNTGLGLRDPNEQAEPRGFFGRLWHNVIKPRIGAIVGLLVGGPIGAILGELIQQGVNVVFQRGGGLVEISEGGTVSVDPDQYPISQEEENELLAFIETQLKPTIAALANMIDTVINVNVQSRLQNPVTNTVLQKANQVLQSISVIRAHNDMILQYGQRVTRYGSARYSTNYIRNKVEVIELTLNALEQATIQYITNHVANYRLVERPFTASYITQIEAMSLFWEGRTVNTNKKVYVSESVPPAPDETPVEVIQTTTTTANTPDVVVNSPSGNNVNEIKESKPSLIKIGAIAAIAIIGYKALGKKKK